MVTNPPLAYTLVREDQPQAVVSALASGASGAPALSTSAVASSPVGSYAITVSPGTLAVASPNYVLDFSHSANGELTIGQATLVITANPASRAYGAADPTFTDTISGFINGQTLATSGVTGAPSFTTTADSTSHVGTYNVVAGIGSLQSGDYLFSFVPNTLTITPVPLTIEANATSQPFGTKPSLSASFIGLVNGDTAASLTAPGVLSTTATGTSPPGTYPITVSGASSADYTKSGKFAPPVPRIVSIGQDRLGVGITPGAYSMFVQNHHSLEELQRLTKALTKKRIWLRHQAVVLAKQGHSAPAIARALGCSHRAVQAWVGRYNQGGLAALQERPHTGRPPRLAAADVPRFRDRLEAGPTPEDGVCTFRCQDLRRILEEEFGVSLRRQAIYDLLHRLDYSSLMPRPQHEQANPEVQEFFKEIVVEQIDAIAAAHPEAEIHTYFQDEARFGQKGTITRVWARRGSRPRAVRQTGFSSLYVLAAVCAATGAMSAVIMPTLNTEVVNLFLEQFSRELPAGVHAVLIWDGAGFHTGEDVVVPSNVSLIQLPPYSPELNPVENLWHYLRAHHWSNRPYRDYDALQEEAVRSLCAVREDTETIKTICNPPYISRGA